MSTISPRNSSNPLRVADALAWVHTHVTQLGPEVIPVQEAAGRILAEDLAATLDLPPFNRVGADGFALRANEAVGASAYNPLPFRITPATADLPPNSAVRVTSGDVLPLGADAVVRIEHVELSAEEVVTIVDPVVAGNCVECIGCHLELAVADPPRRRAQRRAAARLWLQGGGSVLPMSAHWLQRASRAFPLHAGRASIAC